MSLIETSVVDRHPPGDTMDMMTDGESDGSWAQAPRDAVKKAFAERLWMEIQRRGWNQSELARRAGIGRDSVSAYLTRRQFPEPVNLRRIAQALGLAVEDILPAQLPPQPDSRVVAMTETRPGMVKLRITAEIPSSVAVRILALLQEAEQQPQ